jgi:hypothetical protein
VATMSDEEYNGLAKEMTSFRVVVVYLKSIS